MWNSSRSTLSASSSHFLLPTSQCTEADLTNGTVDSTLSRLTYCVSPIQPARSASLDTDYIAPVSAPACYQLNSPSRNERPTTKRTLRDRELPTGKSLVDMYSKRSASLVHKGEELAHLTRAYVLVFAARPESIGEGNHRLFVSEEFKNADPDLVARINKVTRELNEISLELAHRAGWDVHGCKKRRTGGSDGSAEVQEHIRPSLSTNFASNSSTQNRALTPLPSHIATSNPAAPVPIKQTPAFTIRSTSRINGVEQKKIESLVRALIKLPLNEDNLDILHDIAQSEIGVRAIHHANAIPILTGLLEKDLLPSACRIALVLTSMMHHWMTCIAILRAGAVVPVIRLLSRGVGSEILKSISYAFGRCIPWCPRQFQYSESHEIPTDVLGELSDLLSNRNMEVRLAAVQVIRGLASARYWNFMKHGSDHGKSIALGLCCLVLHCRDLSEKELIVSAISAMRKWLSPDTEIEIEKIIDLRILPPLILLLDDNNSETTLTACRILRKPLILKDYRGGNGATLRHLTQFLSHPDDEVFVEVAWTASALTWCDSWDRSLPESFPLTAIKRLIRLLHHHKEHVVVCALHSIADARCLEYVLVDFLFGIADEGGVGHIVNLIESSNPDVAEAALLIVRRIHGMDPEVYPSRRSVLQYFLEHGIIQALLRNLACDSSRLFQQSSETISLFWQFMDRPLFTSTMHHLIHLLPSLGGLAKTAVLFTVTFPVRAHVKIAPLDPSSSRLLLHFARDGMKSLNSFRRIMEFICYAIIQCRESREAFRAAGAESFLANPQLQSCLNELGHAGRSVRNQIPESLRSLRES